MINKDWLLLKLDDELNMGNLLVVRRLLEQGTDVNGKNALGDTPLLVAVYTGQAEAVRLLLEFGADKNARNLSGKNAMELAYELGHKEVVSALAEPLSL